MKELVGFKHLDNLTVGQIVYYRMVGDTDFVEAEVSERPERTGVLIRLNGDYRGKNTNYDAGIKIFVNAYELYF